MSDRLIDYTGGYGNVYKTITKDSNLSIEAKGIYATCPLTLVVKM